MSLHCPCICLHGLLVELHDVYMLWLAGCGCVWLALWLAVPGCGWLWLAVAGWLWLSVDVSLILNQILIENLQFWSSG